MCNPTHCADHYVAPSPLPAGIEEIGVSVEEPFTILPLEVISRTIEGNVKELLAMHSAEAKGKELGGNVVTATDLVPKTLASTRA